MNTKISLKEAERKVFRQAHNDGLWDIFLGCFLLELAIAPGLSVYLGDFWSSAVFLPFWGLVFLAIFLIRKNFIAPRVGRVKFGPVRRRKMTRFSLVMLAFNLLALILGFIFASRFGLISGYLPMVTMSLALLFGFSLAGYFLDFPRLYLYGLMAGFAPIVGEWLFRHKLASHHGFPVTFGFVSGIMILVGIATFLRFLVKNPIPTLDSSSKSS